MDLRPPLTALHRAALVVALSLLLVVVTTGPATAQADFAGPVIISEFMASNSSTIVDDDGDSSDWIELHNTSDARVSLLGWQLRDGGSSFTLPDLSLAADERLVVWASGKNRSTPAGTHTNFRLSAAGELLVLLDSLGATATSFSPSFPPQSGDISYGVTDGSVGYMTHPTPGAVNAAVGGPPASPPAASVPSGIYDVAQTVTLASPDPDGFVRYTIDGSVPDDSSPIADTPVLVEPTAGAVTIRARAYAPGRSASAETSFSYVFPLASMPNHPDAAADIPNLPILVINDALGGESFGDDPPKPGRVDYIDPNGPGFSIGAGLASTGAGELPAIGAEPSIRLHFDSEYGASELQYPLFADRGRGTFTPADTFDKIDLRNFSGDAVGVPALVPESRPVFVSDRFWKNTALDMGELAPHGRYVQVYAGGVYHGMYHMREVFGADFHAQYVPGGKDDHSSVFYPEWWNQDFVKVPDGDRTDWDQVYALAGDYQAIAPHIDIGSFLVLGLGEGWVNGSRDIAGFREQEYRFSGRRWGGDGGRWITMQNDNDWETVRITTGNDIFGGVWANDFLYRWMNDDDFRAEADDMIRFAFCGDGPMTETAMLARFNEAVAELELALAPTMVSRVGDNWQNARANIRASHDHARALISAAAADRVRAAQDAGFLASCDRRPVLDLVGETHNLVGDQVQLVATTDSLDGDDVFSAIGLPDGVTINAATGVLSGVPTTAGMYAVTVTATNPEGLSASTVVEWRVEAAGRATMRLVLNEYNAVGSGERLGDGLGSDLVFGDAVGNGGDWMEFVVVEDADLRGMHLELWDRDRADDRLAKTATLTFSQHTLLEDVPAGTIITVAEDHSEDLSFGLLADDWVLDAHVSNEARSVLFTVGSQENFDTNRHGFQVLVRAADQQPLGSFQGETDAWRAQRGNVSTHEVFAVCATPTTVPLPVEASAGVAETSTFGSMNECDGVPQSFGSLRVQDPNCDGTYDIVDSLVIAQFTVGNRTAHSGCPLADAATQVNVARGDVNADTATDVVDALVIAQCTVLIDNPFC